MIQIKRIYDKPAKTDGFRLLIDKLWPRGISKEEAKINLWFKEIAPTPSLRKWFSHDPKKFPEFTKRYKAELHTRKAFLTRIKDIEEKNGTVTLLYATKDQHHNHAQVLLEVIKNMVK